MLLGLGVAALAGVLYIVYLDRLVTRQFEGRRWTLPAQVFAAPLELYTGLALAPAQLEQELQRLHYRRAERPERPGTYRVQGARFDIALRPALFADETRNAELLSIVAGPQSLESLRDSAGREVAVLRLEPLLIGSIFPIHGEGSSRAAARSPSSWCAATSSVRGRRCRARCVRRSWRWRWMRTSPRPIS